MLSYHFLKSVVLYLYLLVEKKLVNYTLYFHQTPFIANAIQNRNVSATFRESILFFSVFTPILIIC